MELGAQTVNLDLFKSEKEKLFVVITSVASNVSYGCVNDA